MHKIDYRFGRGEHSLLLGGLVRQHFVRIEYAVGVEHLLHFAHVFYHLRTLTMPKILGLQETHSVLRADAAPLLFHVVEHEGLQG